MSAYRLPTEIAVTSVCRSSVTIYARSFRRPRSSSARCTRLEVASPAGGGGPGGSTRSLPARAQGLGHLLLAAGRLDDGHLRLVAVLGRDLEPQLERAPRRDEPGRPSRRLHGIAPHAGPLGDLAQPPHRLPVLGLTERLRVTRLAQAEDEQPLER